MTENPPNERQPTPSQMQQQRRAQAAAFAQQCSVGKGGAAAPQRSVGGMHMAEQVIARGDRPQLFLQCLAAIVDRLVPLCGIRPTHGNHLPALSICSTLPQTAPKLPFFSKRSYSTMLPAADTLRLYSPGICTTSSHCANTSADNPSRSEPNK